MTLFLLGPQINLFTPTQEPHQKLSHSYSLKAESFPVYCPHEPTYSSAKLRELSAWEPDSGLVIMKVENVNVHGRPKESKILLQSSTESGAPGENVRVG